MRNVVCVVVLIAALAVGCKKAEPSGGVAGAGVAGIGVSGAGVGVSGAGVGVSGIGASGMAAGPVQGCDGADKSVTGSAAHAGALEILSMESPCGFSSCHIPPTGKGTLVLKGVTDLRAALVGKMSCEAGTIPLVDGKGGDAALQNSWLWQKLTAPADSSGGMLMAQSTWGAMAGTCGQMGGFGTRMPQDFTAMVLDSGTGRLSKIRNWICAGAPGP
jgi:hypothetical protein